MPYKKYGKKTSFKRVSRRGSKRSPFLVASVNRAIQHQNKASRLYSRGGAQLVRGKPNSFNPFPPTMFAQHKYCEDFAFTTDNLTGLMGSDYAFRFNSMYDPNFSGTGHQPQGFDQMIAMYSRYTVYKVRLSIRVTTASSGTCCLGISYRPSVNSTSFNLTARYPSNVEETPNCLVIDCNTPGVWNSGDIFIADIEGVPRSQVFNDISYTGTAGTNPTIVPFFSMAAGDWAQVPSATVRFSLTIEFFVQWSNVAITAPS